MLKKDNEIVEELDKSFEEALRDIKAIHFSSNIVDIKAMSVSVLRVLSASLKMAKHDKSAAERIDSRPNRYNECREQQKPHPPDYPDENCHQVFSGGWWPESSGAEQYQQNQKAYQTQRNGHQCC